MADPIALADANFQQEVLQAPGTVLVDFYADCCGPCRAMAPIVADLANEFAGKVKICKLDVMENQQTTEQFGIMNIPTMIIFKGGKPVERIVGMLGKSALQAKLTQHSS